MTPVLVIGTRGSALALAQTALVTDALDAHGIASRVVVIETDGDRRTPDTAWGEGAFVAAIERALLDGSIDLAIHSAKDVPTQMDPALRIGAYLPRADARDALVVRAGAQERSLASLPTGARLGTDSPRRTGFVLARRPDLRVHPLHGNVDTRLRRLAAGETDALVLACAGLDRLGLADRAVERFDTSVIPPAPGQGAIAVQIRSADADAAEAVATIDDGPTRLAVETERRYLAACGGGCRSPIGAFARVDGDEIHLVAGHVATDGTGALIEERRGSAASATRIADGLAAQHTSARRDEAAPRVVVTRAAGTGTAYAAALRAVGLTAVAVPAIEVEPIDDPTLAAAVHEPFAWVVVTSVNGAAAVGDALRRAGVQTTLTSARWAVVGPATRDAVLALGVADPFVPATSTGRALAETLPIRPGERVLVVRGAAATDVVATILRRRGAVVVEAVAYRTIEGPAGSLELLRRAAEAEPLDAVIFTSGSTVRGLTRLAAEAGLDLRGRPAVCIGPSTARAARALRYQVVTIAPSTEPDAVAEAVAKAVEGAAVADTAVGTAAVTA